MPVPRGPARRCGPMSWGTPSRSLHCCAVIAYTYSLMDGGCQVKARRPACPRLQAEGAALDEDEQADGDQDHGQQDVTPPAEGLGDDRAGSDEPACGAPDAD